jgi:hypothetical protein
MGLNLTTNQIATLRKAYSLRFVAYPHKPFDADNPPVFVQATVTTRSGPANFRIPCAEATVTRGHSGLKVLDVERAQLSFIVNEQPFGVDRWRTICSWMRPGDHLTQRWVLDERHLDSNIRHIALYLAVYRPGARTRAFQIAHVATVLEHAGGDTLTRT